MLKLYFLPILTFRNEYPFFNPLVICLALRWSVRCYASIYSSVLCQQGCDWMFLKCAWNLKAVRRETSPENFTKPVWKDENFYQFWPSKMLKTSFLPILTFKNEYPFFNPLMISLALRGSVRCFVSIYSFVLCQQGCNWMVLKCACSLKTIWLETSPLKTLLSQFGKTRSFYQF